MSEPREVHIFTNLQEAYMAKSFLESEGIEVFLLNEITTVVFNVFGGVKMIVPEEQMDKAIKLLEQGVFL